MRRKTASAGLVALVFATMAPTASADLIPIVAAGSIWEYTLTDPTASDPTWNTVTGGWLTGPAPFGNYSGGVWDPDGYYNYATYWPADGVAPDGNDLWVRTSFSMDGFDPSSILWNLGVDNGFELYLNGNFIASHNAEGYTTRWEYTGDFGQFLTPGMNVLAAALEDHSVATAFDMEVVGQPVPEPGTLLLTGLGFATTVLLRRRRRR